MTWEATSGFLNLTQSIRNKYLFLLSIISHIPDALTVDVPDEVEVDELSPVSVKCLATHDNPGLTIYLRWIKMGDPSFQRDGAYLNFSRVMAAQAGVYICEAAVQEDPPVHVRKNLTLFVNCE